MADVLFFSQVKEDEFIEIGEKGKKLSMLYKSGFKIPPGFIISQAAMKKILSKRDARNSILKQRNIEFPEELADEIIDAYLSLSVSLEKTTAESFLKSEEVFVAVRGSGKTILNIKGKDRLFKAILEANDFSPEKEQNLFSPVIVQRMIDAEKSGVAFTSGNDIIITSCFGLGEGLESGFIFPDTYVIDKTTSVLKGIKIGDKNYEYIRDIETEEIGKQELGSRSKQQVLEESELNEILAQLKKVTGFFGKEQKMEWSIRRNMLYIMQSKDNANEQVERVEFEVTENEDIITENPVEKIDIQPEEDFFIAPETVQEKENMPEEIEIVHLDSITGKKEVQEETPEEISITPEVPEEIMIKQEDMQEDAKEEDSIFSSYKGFKDESRQGINRIAELAKLNAGNTIVYCHIAVKEKLKERILKYVKSTSDNFTEILDELIQYETMEDELKYRKLDKAARDFMVKNRFPEPEEVMEGLRLIR